MERDSVGSLLAPLRDDPRRDRGEVPLDLPALGHRPLPRRLALGPRAFATAREVFDQRTGVLGPPRLAGRDQAAHLAAHARHDRHALLQLRQLVARGLAAGFAIIA